MTKTVAPTTTLEALDDDLRAACADRDKAWRAVVIKDSAANRKEWDDSCAQVDGLLEMRHGLLFERRAKAGER